MFERIFGKKAKEFPYHLSEFINHTESIGSPHGDIQELMDKLIRNNVSSENLPYLYSRKFFISNNKYSIIVDHHWFAGKYGFCLNIYIIEPIVRALPNDSRCCVIYEHYDEIIKGLRDLSDQITEDREKSKIARRQSEYCLRKLWERVDRDKP